MTLLVLHIRQRTAAGLLGQFFFLHKALYGHLGKANNWSIIMILVGIIYQCIAIEATCFCGWGRSILSKKSDCSHGWPLPLITTL